jgi:hypothetical protein
MTAGLKLRGAFTTQILRTGEHDRQDIELFPAVVASFMHIAPRSAVNSPFALPAAMRAPPEEMPALFADTLAFQN